MPETTYFETKNCDRSIHIRDAVQAIGEDKMDAIIGYFVFFETDSTGKINKITKESSFTGFFNADVDTLERFRRIE